MSRHKFNESIPSIDWMRWYRFHRAHPEVFERIIRLCKELQDRGFKYYGMVGLIASIRHHMDLERGPDDRFKINQNYCAFYARWYTWVYARTETELNFFRFREGDWVDASKPAEIVSAEEQELLLWEAKRRGEI